MLLPDILVAVAALVVVPLVSIWVRRLWLSRSGGAIELSLRLKAKEHGAGWVLGVGRFVGDDLQWFRVFSLSPRPRRTLSRRDLAVRTRRAPWVHETLALLNGAEVVELTSSVGEVQIAMDPSALTGFMAWLEARPPGATLPR